MRRRLFPLNIMHAILISLVLTSGLWSSKTWAHTNLPPAPQGVFNASTRIEIDAPIEKVWEAVTDFPSYPNWNPFVRSQVMINEFYIPDQDQTPRENHRMIIQLQIPPLKPPVTNSTPPNPLHAQSSLENITHVQHDLYRIAWTKVSTPQATLTAERWSALSVVKLADGKNRTVYESREVFGGPLAYAVERQYGKGLQEGFDAQGVAMKVLLEGQRY